jgi:hypothetical protein
MTRFLSVLVVAAMLAVGGVGCNKNADMEGTAEGSSTDMAMKDACPHCAGDQKATADGKCPKCGMAAATSK